MSEARYDSVAHSYASLPDSYDDPATVALLELVGTVGGLRVLDLACGHGRIARELARRGADVIGVDLSNALLEKAREIEAKDSLGIHFVHADASSAATLDGEVFDKVICSFGLTDIDDLSGVSSTVGRVLRPAGAFVFSILHPCFPGGTDVSGSWPTTRSYFDEGWWMADGALSVLRQQVGANHRKLSTYFNTLSDKNLIVDRTLEPQPDEEWSGKRGDAGRHPVFLVARCIKQ